MTIIKSDADGIATYRVNADYVYRLLSGGRRGAIGGAVAAGFGAGAFDAEKFEGYGAAETVVKRDMKFGALLVELKTRWPAVVGRRRIHV